MTESNQNEHRVTDASYPDQNMFRESTDNTEGSQAERLVHKPVTTIDVRRHSDYDGGFPKGGWGKATEEEQEKLGHLTKAGVENAQRVATEIIEKRLDEADGNVDFLVIASPTYWLGDDKLGQRAIETAKIYSDEIKRQFQERGIPTDHLLNMAQLKANEHEIGDVRASKKLGTRPV